MHDTAYRHGRLFFETYWQPPFRDIAELGSFNVNGALRDHAPAGSTYLGMDIDAGPGVDLIVTAGEPIPVADASVDVVVTSSCFEHDVCFWDTFLDLVRLLRPGGLLYMNVPSNGQFHRFPLDCWRFYPDAGVALVEWARRKGQSVELLESFVVAAGADGWADYVAVFHKAGGAPLEPRGRISDRVAALNVYRGAGAALQNSTADWVTAREAALHG